MLQPLSGSVSSRSASGFREGDIVDEFLGDDDPLPGDLIAHVDA